MKKSNSFLARVFPTFLMVVFAAAFLQLKAQDPSFSQFYNNPVYYNPGYIGLNPGLRTRFNYRDQWTGLPQDFKTYNFSVDMAERNIPGSGGLGLLVSSDKAGTGTIKSTNVGIGTAARIPLYENMVAQMGFMVSYAQKSVNWDEMVFTDQLSARYGNIYKTAFEAPASNRVSYPDFSVGGVYRFVASASRYSNIQGTLGAAVHHVFTPNESFLGLESPLPRKLVITGDLVFGKDQGRSSSYRSYKKSSGGFKFNPAFQYEKQAEFSTLILGMNILKSSIYFGGWIRNEDFDFFNATDAIFQVGVNAPWGKDTRMKIMYTYDYIIQTNMNVAGHGSHEISLIFEFDEFSLFGNNSSGYGPGRNNGRNHKEMECTPF